MKINHVMHGEPSPIFKDLLTRYHEGMSQSTIISKEPDPEGDLFVYWRAFMAKEIKHPAVAYIHADLSNDVESLRADKYSKDFDSYLCICDKQRRDLIDYGISENKITVIHHGYDTKLKSIKHTESDVLRVAMFSNRYDRLIKGESLLYSLMKDELVPLANKFEFIFSGNGRYTEHFFAQEMGYTSSLVAPANYDALIRLYGNIDLLLILSEAEGGPASFPEALAAGVGVLATNVGMIQDFNWGLEEDELRTKLVDIINNRGALIDIKGSDHPLLCSWETQIKKLEDYFVNVSRI